MEYIVINGQKRLQGNVTISGAKNAAVAIIPAAIAANGVCVIDNVPYIEDVINLTKALESLGAVCEFKDNNHTLVIDTTSVTSYELDEKLTKSTRASYYFMGALLARFGKVVIPMPGGCEIGARPVGYHMKGFEALGATSSLEHGIVTLEAKDGLQGANIYLDSPSVGATINIMIAAVFAKGVTQIENSAKEPHVVDTASFLNKLGAKISGAGTATIRISGVDSLGGGEYTVIPDAIEAGTYMIAAAITCGDVTVENIIPKHMDSLTSKLREIGAEIEEGVDSIRVKVDGQLKGCEVKTAVYPGFPTDLQSQMATLLCTASSFSTVTENIFENRYRYVGELRRLGAITKIDSRSLLIEGNHRLTGAKVEASDLRAGAALVIAGLAAEGKTMIGGVEHIDRGYEDIEQKLRGLGADIKRVVEED